MKRSYVSEHEIVSILKEADAGMPVLRHKLGGAWPRN